MALNVNNVFDKLYYSALGTPASGNWYGEPRSATLAKGESEPCHGGTDAPNIRSAKVQIAPSAHAACLVS